MSSRDSELLNAMKKLNSSISDLNDVMSVISGKMGTPANTGDKLIGAAAIYFLILNGYLSFSTTAIQTAGCRINMHGLVHVSDKTFMAIGPDGMDVDYNGIYSFESDGSDASEFCSVTENVKSIDLLAGSTTYSSYYVVALSELATGAGGTWQLFLVDSDGVEQKVVTFDGTDRIPDTVFYDSENDRILVYSQEANSIYSVTISGTGATLSKVYTVPYIYYDVKSTSYISDLNLILITVDANDVASRPNDHAWFIYDPDKQLFISSGFYDVVTGESETAHYACYNTELDTLDLWSGVRDGTTHYMHHCGLTFAQLSNMVGPNVYGSVSVDDAGDSLTVDGTVAVSSSALPTGAATSAKQDTMITALQLIDNLVGALKSVNTDQLVVEQEVSANVVQANVLVTDVATQICSTRASRRALVIQNADTTNPMWIGKDTVTTANGIEVLPKQLIILEHYDGSTEETYGICAVAKTADVRYLEVY